MLQLKVHTGSTTQGPHVFDTGGTSSKQVVLLAKHKAHESLLKLYLEYQWLQLIPDSCTKPVVSLELSEITPYMYNEIQGVLNIALIVIYTYIIIIS